MQLYIVFLENDMRFLNLKKKEHMKGKKLELVFQNEGVASITIWNFNNAI